MGAIDSPKRSEQCRKNKYLTASIEIEVVHTSIGTGDKRPSFPTVEKVYGLSGLPSSRYICISFFVCSREGHLLTYLT